MLQNNKIMLVYGIDDAEKNILDKIIVRNSIPNYVLIEDCMTSMRIKDIIKGLKIGVYSKDIPKQPVILFNNFSDDELEKAIKDIRASILPPPILAVVTPTSMDWTFKNLIEHLIEERDWHKNTGKRGTKT